MNKMIGSIGVIALVAVTLSACSGFKAKRVDDKEADEKAMKVTDKWVQGDTILVMQNTMAKLNENKKLKKYKSEVGREIKVFVAEIQNNTPEAYLPVKDIEEALLEKLSESEMFVLIDAEKRNALLKEITYQNDGMVDPAQAKKIGKQAGADVMIFGTVNMKPEERDGKRIMTYAVNFRLTDIESATEVARTRELINKYSEGGGAGW